MAQVDAFALDVRDPTLRARVVLVEPDIRRLADRAETLRLRESFEPSRLVAPCECPKLGCVNFGDADRHLLDSLGTLDGQRVRVVHRNDDAGSEEDRAHLRLPANPPSSTTVWKSSGSERRTSTPSIIASRALAMPSRHACIDS